MLILAGVSLNAIVGDNGIVNNALQAKIKSRFSSYKEVAEMTYIEKYGNAISSNEEIDPPTVFGDYVKNYITNLEDQDSGKFALINGQMYYLGEDENEKKACSSLGIIIKPADINQEDYIAQFENDAVLALLKNQNGNVFTDINEESGDNINLGIKLWDKTIENSNKWKIISEIEDNTVKATYGTGWYYVPAGTLLKDVGILNHNYIINYDTEKCVQFDSNKHSMLSFETTLGVKDNLMFCFDPTILENVSQEELKNNPYEYLGEGVELKNFNYNENSGFSSTSYKLDGVDDYIQINFENFDAEDAYNNGMTYEFYGKFYGSSWRRISNNSEGYEEQIGYALTFGRTNGEYMSCHSWFDPVLRYTFTYSTLDGTINFEDKDQITWASHNHIFDFSNFKLDKESDVYIQHVVTPDFENERISEKLYINGRFVSEGFSKLNYWRRACDQYKINSIAMIGLSTGGYIGDLYYWSKCDGYVNRLYKRALNDVELTANYNQSVAYHEYLENESSGATGGETGGENISDVN